MSISIGCAKNTQKCYFSTTNNKNQAPSSVPFLNFFLQMCYNDLLLTFSILYSLSLSLSNQPCNPHGQLLRWWVVFDGSSELFKVTLATLSPFAALTFGGW